MKPQSSEVAHRTISPVVVWEPIIADLPHDLHTDWCGEIELDMRHVAIFGNESSIPQAAAFGLPPICTEPWRIDIDRRRLCEDQRGTCEVRFVLHDETIFAHVLREHHIADSTTGKGPLA